MSTQTGEPTTAPPGAAGAPTAIPAGPTAPPIAPGEVEMLREEPRWPTVLGVFMIVLGSLAALGGVGGVVSSLFMEDVLKAVPGANAGVAQQTMAVAAQYKSVNAALAAGGLLLGLMCLAGGIGLVRRRRWGALVSNCWAGAKLLLALAQAIVQGMVQSATMTAVLQTAGRPSSAAPAVNMFSRFGAVMGVFTFVWLAVLPVIVLLVVNLHKHRAQRAAWM